MAPLLTPDKKGEKNAPAAALDMITWSHKPYSVLAVPNATAETSQPNSFENVNSLNYKSSCIF